MNFSRSFKNLSAGVMFIALGLSSVVQAGGHKSAAPAAPGDIVDVAASAGSFNTLVAAVKAADLVGALGECVERQADRIIADDRPKQHEHGEQAETDRKQGCQLAQLDFLTF